MALQQLRVAKDIKDCKRSTMYLHGYIRLFLSRSGIAKVILSEQIQSNGK